MSEVTDGAGMREEGKSGAAITWGDKLAGPAPPTCRPGLAMLPVRSATSTPVLLGGVQPLPEGSQMEGLGTLEAGP